MVNGRLIRIETRRSVGLWLFPPLLALAWFYLHGGQFGFLTMLWVQASVAVRGIVFFIGPTLAGATAWMAGRERRRGVEELLATTPQPAWSRQLATWTGTVLWGLLAYALVALAVGVLTARQAVWGGPILWPVIAGLLALPAHAALGFALGRFVPTRFTAPLVAVVFFFAQAFVWVGGFGAAKFSNDPRFDWLTFLSPTARLDQSVWYGIRPNVGLPQALFFLGLTGLALGSLALRERQVPITWGIVAMSGFLTFAGVALVYQAVSADGMQEREAARRAGAFDPRDGLIPFELVCTADPLPVCAHPAYRPWLEENAPLINEVAAPVLGLPGAPTRAEQRTPLAPKPFGETLLFSPQSGQRSSIVDVVRNLVTAPGYPGPDYASESRCPDGQESYSCRLAQSAVGLWLLRRAGFEQGERAFGTHPDLSPAATRFAALPPEQQRAWLQANYAALREGRVPLSALP